jgi:4-alpha-glucanotransferase
MPLDDALRAAAEQIGVQQEFWDIFGRPHVTLPETNRAILTAIGFDCSTPQALEASLHHREEAERARLLPPVLVVSANEPIKLPRRAAGVELEVTTEQGDHWTVRPYLAGGEGAELGLKLPLGYHEVRAGQLSMRLIVTPDRAHVPAPGLRAGIGVMLYGLRSRRNWGCGDFRDLRALVRWAVPALHADFIALNPLHAIHNRRPFNTSPYLPNSVYYRNPLYLDIEGVPGYDRIRLRFEDVATRAEIARLRDLPTVEYEQVAALKRRALEQIFEANPPSAECMAWIEHEGNLLMRYATYCALDEHLHSTNPELWVWPDWPAEYRDPASPAVTHFFETHPTEIIFHAWMQWLVDKQIAGVQQLARQLGMSIGLYHDLALATDRCGSDLWAHRDFFVAGARVGSPPDDFSPSGQDWSFPPPNEERHREDGYRLFAESIRKSARHGGALRIDHVMRLFRLYWIPEGQTAAHGAYVRARAADLVRILALESLRGEVVIVGEDLGTVEPVVRETLARFGVLSYRLLYFEREAGAFKRPSQYPVQALVSTTTHDLATIAGFWSGADIRARFQAGTIDAASRDAQMASRGVDKQRLLDALLAAGLLPAGYERDAGRLIELTGEVHQAIIGFLATTPCSLWLVNQEDITMEPDQQNLPGTTWQYPNWGRKMRWSLEELSAPGAANDCAVMVRHWVERSGRAHAL